MILGVAPVAPRIAEIAEIAGMAGMAGAGMAGMATGARMGAPQPRVGHELAVGCRMRLYGYMVTDTYQHDTYI